MNFSLLVNIVNIRLQKIYKGSIIIKDGIIENIMEMDSKEDVSLPYAIPGFIDAHVHIESSMLVPSEFAKLAVIHGTVATVSDPHEIANVCGIEGVEYMIQNGKTVHFKFHFGAPSCVPATTFETAGATIDAKGVGQLLLRDDIYYLSEMMNYPGVINDDIEIIKKIDAAKKMGKPVDGHAPGLRGEALKKYVSAGISTDHECFTIEEALEKLTLGISILIREGSAAKNFEALIELLHEYPSEIMFCSDDKHPDSLVAGHINVLCKRAVAKGINIFNVLRAACINPVLHYKMKVGLLEKQDPADFILLKDLVDFEVLQTYINGELVAQSGNSLIATNQAGIINNFNCTLKTPEDFAFKLKDDSSIINVIEALDGQLITNKLFYQINSPKGNIESILKDDILKIVVVNRYNNTTVAVSFVKNFGLKSGAIASSVAHDSHNIIAVGVDDASICEAVNMIINEKGGICVVIDPKDRNNNLIIQLPVAGLMSIDDGRQVAKKYTQLDEKVKELGCQLSAPFMTLSFLALLVIPHLKLSDKGLFDGDSFNLIKTDDNI